MDQVSESDRYRSVFKFELREPDAMLTDIQFDDIHRQILIWSLNESVPCSIILTLAGFSVEVNHYLDLGDIYATSLQKHLFQGVLGDLKSEGLSLAFRKEIF